MKSVSFETKVGNVNKVERASITLHFFVINRCTLENQKLWYKVKKVKINL